VSSVLGTISATYTYDANGNLVSGAGRTLTYKSFNLPGTITQGADSFQYVYNVEHERVKLVVTRASGVYTSIYLHPNGGDELLFEKETTPSGTEHRHYVNVGSRVLGVYLTKSSGAPEMRYFHFDSQDSLTVITNNSGAVLERLAYEAFGKRRFPNGTADPTNVIFGVTTDRGFTTHEHLDELGLIHMNGRIYDPLLARFMTADPTVPHPLNLQSYNRYSYARNNPIRVIDPDGFDDGDFDPPEPDPEPLDPTPAPPPQTDPNNSPPPSTNNPPPSTNNSPPPESTPPATPADPNNFVNNSPATTNNGIGDGLINSNAANNNTDNTSNFIKVAGSGDNFGYDQSRQAPGPVDVPVGDGRPLEALSTNGERPANLSSDESLRDQVAQPDAAAGNQQDRVQVAGLGQMVRQICFTLACLFHQEVPERPEPPPPQSITRPISPTGPKPK
jgi:RHS repeat-associated protein